MPLRPDPRHSGANPAQPQRSMRRRNDQRDPRCLPDAPSVKISWFGRSIIGRRAMAPIDRPAACTDQQLQRRHAPLCRQRSDRELAVADDPAHNALLASVLLGTYHRPSRRRLIVMFLDRQFDAACGGDGRASGARSARTVAWSRRRPRGRANFRSRSRRFWAGQAPSRVRSEFCSVSKTMPSQSSASGSSTPISDRARMESAFSGPRLG
jgi:hypothetical protein